MGLLEWVFGGGQRKVPPKDDAIARAIVDRVVDATDKRLKLVRAYQKTLREPALATLEHVRALLTAIPGPVELSAAAWRDSPSLRPFFVKGDEIGEALGRERELRDYFDRTGAAEALAFVGFERAERQVFAQALKGDVLQGEVARTTVSFGNSRVLSPSADLPTLHMELGKRIIDYLAMQALARITALDDRKRELEQERALLKARLRLAESAHRGLAEMGGAADAPRRGPAAIAADLAANEQALASFAATGLMASFLDVLVEVLAAPQKLIRLEVAELSVDAMNYQCEPGTDGAIPLELHQLYLDTRGPFPAMYARIPRSELPTQSDRLAEAEKYL